MSRGARPPSFDPSEAGDGVDRPRVSVVIPVYNRAQVLARALDSLLAQTETDWEAIVVDDGSQDAPEDVVARYHDPRLSVIRHLENRGGSAARNTGMEKASGSYIAFLDSDDVWHSERVRSGLSQASKSPDAAAWVCSVNVITNDGERVGRPRLDGDAIWRLVNFDCGVIRTSALMIRRSVVERGIRFDEQLPAYQERDFLTQIAAQHMGVETSDGVLVEARYDDDYEHVSNPVTQIEALRRIGAKYALVMSLRGRARYHLKLMRAYVSAGEMEAARKHSRKAVIAEPLAARRWAVAVSSLFGNKIFSGMYRLYEDLAPTRW